MIYIKITLPGESSGYLDTIEGAKTVIDEMVSSAKNGDFDCSFQFSAVEMSEDEYKALPESKGF